MNNPFASIDARLHNIENLLLDIKHGPIDKPSIDDDLLLTRDEACELLQINKTTLWSYTKKGKLQSYGIGNRVYYKRDEVMAALKPLKNSAMELVEILWKPEKISHKITGFKRWCVTCDPTKAPNGPQLKMF